MREVKVIHVRCVKVNIPKDTLIKCFEEHATIDYKTYLKISQKLAQVESAIHQLSNIKSVLELLQNRWVPFGGKISISEKNHHTCIVGGAKAPSQIRTSFT